jgi:hypothetical protein
MSDRVQLQPPLLQKQKQNECQSEKSDKKRVDCIHKQDEVIFSVSYINQFIKTLHRHGVIAPCVQSPQLQMPQRGMACKNNPHQYAGGSSEHA